MPGEFVNAPILPGTPVDEGADMRTFHIVVIAGNDAVNILNRKTAMQPVVQVCDKNNQPVAGALVTFTSPSHGAGGVFLDGSHSMSLVTDSAGRAGTVGMTPVGTGEFKLSVTATLHGQTATATLSEMNYATVTAASAAGAPGYGNAPGRVATGAGGGGLSTKAKGGIIASIAVAATMGAVLAMNHGGSNTATPAIAIPTASIGLAGPATPGAPH